MRIIFYPLRKLLKILKRFLLTLVLLIVALYIAINLTPVQNWLVKKVARYLSRELHTTVKVDHVNFSLFNKMIVEGLLIEDHKKDTLLYAGAASVNITDWFFLKDAATLKYIGLSNTKVNLNRTDSVWNYQFLVDYFSGSGGSRKKKQGLSLDLKTLKIDQLFFKQTDQWLGKDLVVAVQKLDLLGEDLNFSQKKIFINTLDLTAPFFSQYNYQGNKPSVSIQTSSTGPTSISNASDSTLQWNKEGWQASIKTLHIQNGVFNNERQTDRATFLNRFDGQHVFFYHITGDIKQVQWQQDTVKAVVSLAANERSGLEIKQLKANFRMQPTLMEFSNLDMKVNNSTLGNYYAMHYEHISDMKDFLHSVVLEGNFAKSTIYSNDLAIFAPALKSWNKIFSVQGSVKGTIDNLKSPALTIKNGTTFVEGNIALRGLPDIQNTFIDFNTNNLTTNYNDLITFIPSLKKVNNPKLSRLTNIFYKGNFTGFVNDFVTYGTFTTNLGTLSADLNLKLPKDGTPAYSGKVVTNGFNLGEFIGNKMIGYIAAEGQLKGSSFNEKKLNANFEGKIRSIEYNRYNYQNIDVNGNFSNRTFSGKLNINDPNLQLENLQGTISLDKENTQFDFDATVKTFHLKNLHLTPQDLSLTGNFNLHFTGNNIDNFLGTARVFNATLHHENTRLSFDSLTIQSLIENNQKYLTVRSNELEASVNGRFKIMELPDAFKAFLSNYYPSYIRRPNHKVSNQDFSFFIKTYNIDNYTQIIDKKLTGFDNATLSGNLKLDANELNITALIPQFSYNEKTFIDTRLESRGNIDTLYTQIFLGNVGITDSLHFPSSNISITTNNDVSNIQLKTTATNTINEAELNASVETLTDGITVHFYPSSFIINEQKWQLEKDGELSVRKNFISASEVRFVQGSQSITISTELDDETDKTNLVAQLNKISISDFLPLVLKKPELEGLLSGTAMLKDPFGKQEFSFEGKAESLLVENEPMGNLDLNSQINIKTGVINFNALADNDYAKFTIDGSYLTKDSTNNQLNIDINADKIQLNTLEPYLNTVFDDISGTGVGNVKITGNKKHITLSGSATIMEATLKAAYTQCSYNIKNETIIFNPDEIDLGFITLVDKYGNKGIANGKIYHNFFKDFVFDNLQLQTSRLLLLNTSKKDNAQFYGRVIGSAGLNINGAISDLRININGKPSDKESDSSHIYIPSGNSKEISKIDYIDFIQFGSEMTSQRPVKQGTNVIVDMNIEANPACKIDVILDELTGDIIKAVGNGNLRIRVGNKEPLSIRGRYDIERGEYTFNFQQFVEKGFTVQRGSYISWDKPDPFDATIKIDADYLAKDVDLSSFPSLKGYRAKSDVFVVAHLTNTLKSPEINFEFVLPSSSDYAQDIVVKSKLDDFARDKNEMNKQVSSVLIFNSFVPANQGFLQNQNALSIGINTIGQILSRSLTEYVNRYLQRVGLTFNFGLSSTGSDLKSESQNVSQLQAAANFAFSKQWFKGRLIVTVGGNVDVNNPYVLNNKNNNSNLLLTPDFSAEWLLSKDGKLRVVGFRRSNIDFALGQRNRQGLSLTYRTDFDHLSDVFIQEQKPKKKNKPNQKIASDSLLNK